MKEFRADAFGEWNLEGLTRFLEACASEATAAGEERFASIVLPVRHIDALAVLQSVYDPSMAYGFLECPAREMAMAGAEPVTAFRGAGPSRFEEARVYMDSVLQRTWVIGALAGPLAGPCFLGSFSFAPDPSPEDAFPGAHLFLPRWMVAGSAGRYTAVANLRIEPGSQVVALATRLWAAHSKFAAFDYGAVGGARPILPEGPSPRWSEVGGSGSFQRSVRLALEAIGRGEYEKIVLARAIDLPTPSPIDPFPALQRLRERFPSCTTFAFSGDQEAVFFGSTPETLVRVANRHLETEAIAGSIGRGGDARQDAQLAATLLSSEKDLREHFLVRDSISRGLARLGLEAAMEPYPQLSRLTNVQHLRTPIRARIPTSTHILQIAAELHPTPAVGGVPRIRALPALPQLEQVSRGLYAGLVGWADWKGEGEWSVAIRAAESRPGRVRVWGGAGIVAGSDPECEYAETQTKMQALLAVLA